MTYTDFNVFVQRFDHVPGAEANLVRPRAVDAQQGHDLADAAGGDNDSLTDLELGFRHELNLPQINGELHSVQRIFGMDRQVASDVCRPWHS